MKPLELICAVLGGLLAACAASQCQNRMQLEHFRATHPDIYQRAMLAVRGPREWDAQVSPSGGMLVSGHDKQYPGWELVRVREVRQ